MANRGTQKRSLFSGYVPYAQILQFLDVCARNKTVFGGIWQGSVGSQQRDKVVMTGPGAVGRCEVAVTKRQRQQQPREGASNQRSCSSSSNSSSSSSSSKQPQVIWLLKQESAGAVTVAAILNSSSSSAHLAALPSIPGCSVLACWRLVCSRPWRTAPGRAPGCP